MSRTKHDNKSFYRIYHIRTLLMRIFRRSFTSNFRKRDGCSPWSLFCDNNFRCSLTWLWLVTVVQNTREQLNRITSIKAAKVRYICRRRSIPIAMAILIKNHLNFIEHARTHKHTPNRIFKPSPMFSFLFKCFFLLFFRAEICDRPFPFFSRPCINYKWSCWELYTFFCHLISTLLSGWSGRRRGRQIKQNKKKIEKEQSTDRVFLLHKLNGTREEWQDTLIQDKTECKELEFEARVSRWRRKPTNCNHVKNIIDFKPKSKKTFRIEIDG